MRHRLSISKRERRVLIGLLALVYTLLFTPAVLYVQPKTASFPDLAMIALGSFVYGWALYFTLRASRKLFLVAVPFLFAMSAIASYYMVFYHFEMTYQQLAVVTEVETNTALSFLTLKLVIWVGFSTACGFLLSRFCVRHEVYDPKDARLLFIMGILIACVFTTEVGAVTQRYFPYNLLFAVKDFVAEKIALAHVKDADATVEFHPKPTPITVVLIIGESVRAHNWGLNGYARQTTPLEAKRAGLINFTDVSSCFPMTRIAVPCIMTNAPIDKTISPEFSIIKLFRQMGFFTTTIDMHGMSGSAFGSPVTKIFNEGNRLISFNGNFISEDAVDDKGVEALRGVLAEQKGNTFILFHPFGSHWPYDTRYPERFRKFTPVCNPLHQNILDLAKDMSECVPQELVNAYDNSILYADYINDEVMNSVKGRAALVLYTSDHGQSLGEDGLFLHGHRDAQIERHVPLVVWATPEFAKLYPEQLAKMRAHQHQHTSHDTVFHSLLDCVGAKGSMIDPNQSLCK